MNSKLFVIIKVKSVENLQKLSVYFVFKKKSSTFVGLIVKTKNHDLFI